METYSIGMFAGICSVFVAYAIMSVVKKFSKKAKCDKTKEPYDEMQLIARGKAAIVSVYATLFYNALCIFLQSKGIFEKIDMRLVFFGGIIFTGIFYACICVWKNAYLPFCSKPVKSAIGLVIFAVLCALIGIKPILEHGFFVDGKLSIYNCNFLASAFVLIIAINIFVKNLFDAKLNKKAENEES